jgi:hypothetical protein
MDLMELKEELKRQRIKYIVSSYQLDRVDADQFDAVLDMLLADYPAPLVELAIAEALVENWLTVPMPKGCAFLNQIHDYLKAWENSDAQSAAAPALPIHCSITPNQFQQITGLDPSPVFGVAGLRSPLETR